VQFVQMRGVPPQKAQQCLSDQSAIQRLVDMTNKAEPIGRSGDSILPDQRQSRPQCGELGRAGAQA
jgi:hypothetical protein